MKWGPEEVGARTASHSTLPAEFRNLKFPSFQLLAATGGTINLFNILLIVGRQEEFINDLLHET